MSDYLKKRQEYILQGRPLKVKQKKYIAKVSEKRKAKLAEQKEAGSDKTLDQWFNDRRKEMTGKCALCGGKTEKHSDEHYRKSIHHLLDKRKNMFPSVATHPDNWLEVCFYGNSCHTNIHNGKITWELLKDSKEWDVIKEKLLNILPMVSEPEKKNKLYSKLNELIYGKQTH